MDDLNALGYKFENDKLVKLDGSPYEYNVRPDDRTYNQTLYEKIGDAATKLIEHELVHGCGLRRVKIPVDAGDDEPQSVVYVTDGIETAGNGVVLLVPGSGIKVGQWARKIVLNESLENGSMLAYVKRAISSNLSLIILNNNSTRDPNGVQIRGNASPESHVRYVWDTLVMSLSPSRRVGIVAHSYGGYCIARLFASRFEGVRERVGTVAFTDSVHDNRFADLDVAAFMRSVGVNWVRCDKPIGTPLRDGGNGALVVSAGTLSHEHTTVEAIDQVFEHLNRGLTV